MITKIKTGWRGRCKPVNVVVLASSAGDFSVLATWNSFGTFGFRGNVAPCEFERLPDQWQGRRFEPQQGAPVPPQAPFAGTNASGCARKCVFCSAGVSLTM